MAFNLNMNLQIKRPEWLPGAFDAMIGNIALYKAGRIPNVISAWMLLTPCLRILRAIFNCSNEEIPEKLQQYWKEYILWLSTEIENEEGEITK